MGDFCDVAPACSVKKNNPNKHCRGGDLAQQPSSQRTLRYDSAPLKTVCFLGWINECLGSLCPYTAFVKEQCHRILTEDLC